jgi:hypothetical protein
MLLSAIVSAIVLLGVLLLALAIWAGILLVLPAAVLLALVVWALVIWAGRS